MQQRIIYAITIPATIAAGLLARLNKSSFPDVVNLCLGDALYAFMMFYIVSFAVPSKSAAGRAAVALAICFGIEFFQLYKAGWINDIRLTLPGRLVLGSGFLWSDLAAYCMGIAAAFLIDKFWFSRPKITV
jgi:hypothetical protein